jgi:hypothetical protein
MGLGYSAFFLLDSLRHFLPLGREYRRECLCKFEALTLLKQPMGFSLRHTRHMAG